MRLFGKRLSAAVFSIAVGAIVCGAVMPARAAEPVIFVNYGRTIRIFDASSGAIFNTKLTIGAQDYFYAIATGSDGSLYVAKSESIVHYDSTLSRRQFTYTLPSYALVLFLAVDQAGRLAAYDDNFPGQGVAVYEPGHATAATTIGAGHYFDAAGYASDGTLWLKQPNYIGPYNEFKYVLPGSSATIGSQLIGAPTLEGPAFTFGPDGGLLVMGPGAVISYDGRSGRALRSVPIAGTFERYVAMKLSPDGKKLYVMTGGGYIDVFAYPAGGMPIAIFDVGPFAADFALGSF